MKAETVLSIPHGLVFDVKFRDRKIVPINEVDIKVLFGPDRMWFVPRPHGETDPLFKQIIPYTVVRWEDTVACYKRTESAGEARLREKYSIGLGGHINPADAVVGQNEEVDFDCTLALSTTRELKEEIGLEHTDVVSIRDIGLLYDGDDSVGQVHLGFVREFTISRPWFPAIEETIDKVRFVKIQDLPAYYERMESWSRYMSEFLVNESKD